MGSSQLKVERRSFPRSHEERFHSRELLTHSNPGIVFSERMSMIISNDDDKSYDSSINELSVDNFIKVFLMDVVRNVAFFNDMHKKVFLSFLNNLCRTIIQLISL